MSKKNKAWTDHEGYRRYTCRICGEDVKISLSHWRKLDTNNKRLCQACAQRITTTHQDPRHIYNPSFHYGISSLLI